MARIGRKSEYTPTKIIGLNIVISSLCGLLYLASIFAYFGLYYKPSAASQMDNQGGMSGLANIYYFIFHVVFNTSIALICLIVLAIVATRKNEKSLFTKINFIALGISLLLPIVTIVLFLFP